MFHIWQFEELYCYKELEDSSLHYTEDFASVYKAHGLTNELKHDIIKTCFEDIDRDVLGFICNPGIDYKLTSFFKKIQIVLLQNIIIKGAMMDIEELEKTEKIQ